ncbi:MAG: two-component sensor histidine kinase [Planctomycetota bacterium]|nr:MAG: two-component sensor histidine kinase [Planctomycetota bacterium]
MESANLDMTNEKQEDTWISQLAGGLVHELKNPLSTIKMNLQLLEEEFMKPQNRKEERALKKIQTIINEMNELQNILDDFLRFSKSQTLECHPHSINKAVEEVLDFVEPEAFLNNIQIRKHFDPHLPLLAIDKNLLKQAVLNIVLNAIQAMPDGGELIVRTFANGNDYCIEITDTGYGIAKDKQDKIWEVYYSSKKKGTGLGLPTTMRIVKAHGGTIQLESEENKGTQFTIRLPKHRICKDHETLHSQG